MAAGQRAGTSDFQVRIISNEFAGGPGIVKTPVNFFGQWRAPASILDASLAVGVLQLENGMMASSFVIRYILILFTRSL